MQNLSLDIVEGAITCIIGLSGAGKSTILRLAQRPAPARRGPRAGRRPGYLNLARARTHRDPREDRLFVPVRGAVRFALDLRQRRPAAARTYQHVRARDPQTHVEETLESVGLANVGDRFPAELSGGMVKRAGFARAVIANPHCVLYDEPTTGLDPIITHVLTDLIIRLRARLNGTAVVVSHDLESILPDGRLRGHALRRCDHRLRHGATRSRRSPNPIVQQFLQGSEVGPIPI